MEKLGLLTVGQALGDLGYFVGMVKKRRMHGVGDMNKWVTVGGSYAGALAAWFRSKYPHLTVGAISSSGVIQAIENFRDFD